MIHSANIEEVWPRIAAVVCDMMEPDEVGYLLSSCRSGAAQALASEELVVIITLRGSLDDLELLIWAAVGRGACLVDRYLPAMQQVARYIGAHRITFQPRRLGWPRRLRMAGGHWRLRSDGMFVMEVV